MNSKIYPAMVFGALFIVGCDIENRNNKFDFPEQEKNKKDMKEKNKEDKEKRNYKFDFFGRKKNQDKKFDHDKNVSADMRGIKAGDFDQESLNKMKDKCVYILKEFYMYDMAAHATIDLKIFEVYHFYEDGRLHIVTKEFVYSNYNKANQNPICFKFKAKFDNVPDTYQFKMADTVVYSNHNEWINKVLYSGDSIYNQNENERIKSIEWTDQLIKNEKKEWEKLRKEEYNKIEEANKIYEENRVAQLERNKRIKIEQEEWKNKEKAYENLFAERQQITTKMDALPLQIKQNKEKVKECERNRIAIQNSPSLASPNAMNKLNQKIKDANDSIENDTKEYERITTRLQEIGKEMSEHEEEKRKRKK